MASESPFDITVVPRVSSHHKNCVYLGHVPPEVAERIRRIVAVFVTLSAEEQELVTQEIEIGG